MTKRLASIVMGDKLILPVQSSRIRQYVPHVKFITHSGRLLAVMPHKLEESKILRNLGIATPSPILSQYQWKGRFLPFVHQRATADFITMNPKCYVFNGLGSGKTKSVLWAADYLTEVHLVKRVLIVCPVSVMGVWEDEIFSTTPDKPVSVLTGTKDARLKKLAQNAPICIINFDGVKTVRDALAQGGFDLIVVDECSDAYRNAKTDRHKALSSIIKPMTRLVLMTATPTTTGPTDAYGLSRLMNPHDKLSFTRWRDMVMRKTGPFKWVVKPGSDRAVHDLLQPAIKFATEDCIDLPPITYMYKQAGMGVEQTKAYKLMKRSLVAMIDGGQVTAPNAAVLLTKLLQISCLAAGSEVLTKSGWRPIELITDQDLLWDGEEWTNSSGIVCNGLRPVVDCHGVWMTRDHKVLTVNGWAEAEELINGNADGRFNRAEVRVPDGFEAGWPEQPKKHTVADGMSMRESGDAYRVESKERQTPTPEIMRVQPQGSATESKRTTFPDWHPTVSGLVGGKESLQESQRQKLGQLWWARNNFLQTLGQLREFFSGHGGDVPTGVAVGPHKQQSRVLSEELQMVDSARASQQSTDDCTGYDTGRTNPVGGSSTAHGGEQAGTTPPPAGEESVPVYDIVNAGPRSRFTVRGRDGVPFIVHNCGVVRDSDGVPRYLDNDDRLDILLETVREAGNKAIVFVPYRASQTQVRDYLIANGLTAELVNGDTPPKERVEIFREFQNGDLNVLVAHPRTAAHGLNLTAASTVIWFGPTFSLEHFKQACARIARPGQKNHMSVVLIYATGVEKEVFNTLKHKEVMLDSVMELFKNLQSYD